MPISVPTMYLLNNVRQVKSPLYNAKALSKLLNYRIMFYGLFGTSIMISNTEINKIK